MWRSTLTKIALLFLLGHQRQQGRKHLLFGTGHQGIDLDRLAAQPFQFQQFAIAQTIEVEVVAIA